MTTLKTGLSLICLLFLTACGNIQTVPQVDIERYMGLWYQISAYETSFNQGLVGVTAEYTLLADGSVQVYNKGFQETLDGPLDEILGTAVVVDETTNSRLKVSFPGVPNFPWANYLIVILDAENYQYAVVTDPLKYTLFVLSRTPQLDDGLYADIVQELQTQGFNTEKLLLTPQPAF
ncbi:lipocalin family protein [Ketobacter sp.]|uniref:lipocalin family protein n=1 Tax=Ketobacter sp. TaxID=2083498 RepID=UPI0025C42487|nr:lipocalin family protein [Ketobacter sp.]